MSLRAKLRELEVATRPEHPDLTDALARRWAQLPAHVRTANQMLGRRTAGCEGTHGVLSTRQTRRSRDAANCAATIPADPAPTITRS